MSSKTVVPEEAVVALANELHDREGYMTSLAGGPEYRKAYYVEVARQALEAAAPLIAAIALAPVIESEARAWRALDRLYDITPENYNLGDGKEAAVARAIAHLISFRARAAAVWTER
ncbi:hypothetical protein ACFVWT_04515 [Arthrobacter sp. NPDC058288]|uniref:hypothetical protein n=1 Tax=Arthrobacter sp. NPDC058288 TaxID=3346424 RepID=UPI0036EEDDDF